MSYIKRFLVRRGYLLRVFTNYGVQMRTEMTRFAAKLCLRVLMPYRIMIDLLNTMKGTTRIHSLNNRKEQTLQHINR